MADVKAAIKSIEQLGATQLTIWERVPEELREAVIAVVRSGVPLAAVRRVLEDEGYPIPRDALTEAMREHRPGKPA